jgi:hypothetical protein
MSKTQEPIPSTEDFHVITGLDLTVAIRMA